MSSHPLHIHFQTDHSALADSGRVPSTSANKIRHGLSTILVISSEDIREPIIQGKEEALTIIPLRPVDIDARDKDPRYFLNHPLVVATTTGSRQPQILERIARFEYLQQHAPNGEWRRWSNARWDQMAHDIGQPWAAYINRGSDRPSHSLRTWANIRFPSILGNLQTRLSVRCRRWVGHSTICVGIVQKTRIP